ncbi:MAG TPA: STAS domain-containing protein [Vicinamibacterales bacterium]|nr:STAS domain-containing protein [Vicinamibacterales bacterium]
MAAPTRPAVTRLVLSPQEPLVAGGAAEALEQELQQTFRRGQRDVIVDLASVTAIDSAGIRALVRAHTTSQRLGGSLRLAAVSAAVMRVLEASRLAAIFETYSSVDAARLAAWPWHTVRVLMAGAVLCTVLVWIGMRWPLELAGIQTVSDSLQQADAMASSPVSRHPFIELSKLIAAALIGALVTAIHQPVSRDRPRSLEQAQILLCVSGAIMMIIIGNSLARAFGIAGAAGIVRFRTPVDDPKDVTILFLLMGLGMAAGLGAFAVAGLATAFLCIALLVLERMATQRTRLMSVELSAPGRQFPTRHVEAVLVRNEVVFEPREISQGKNDIRVKYHTWLDPRTSLDDLSAQLMAEGAGVDSVSWDQVKREKI